MAAVIKMKGTAIDRKLKIFFSSAVTPSVSFNLGLFKSRHKKKVHKAKKTNVDYVNDNRSFK